MCEFEGKRWRVQQLGGHLYLTVVLVCSSSDIYLGHNLSLLGIPLKMS
jgi:hypothetical protein